MDSLASIVEIIKSGGSEGLEDILSKNPELAKEDTEQGISILQLAIYYRNNGAVEVLRKYKKNLSVYEAIGIGDLSLVSNFINTDSSLLNSFSPDGFTPLGLASFFGQIPVVKFLLEKGANPNVAANNTFKVAPIHSACAISNLEIVKLLIEGGADVNAKQMKGVTPIHSAAHNGQNQLIQLLIDNGANIHAKTEDGQTPLVMAEETEFAETAILLKNLGGK
ncbi:ankyrin repeat protein [Saonia flava]|uniref:Ankyrin repeat protein n=1 Tax=Saonia flava TaxID=523696 RepID=A0A846QZW8_9FLAO|nr:ankyrin repeat domain-containing protein [Saonia flava]NJB72460.1 ankyrin repeat protein [Saonia flava]